MREELDLPEVAAWPKSVQRLSEMGEKSVKRSWRGP
jgi:hypothetical protein